MHSVSVRENETSVNKCDKCEREKSKDGPGLNTRFDKTVFCDLESLSELLKDCDGRKAS